MRDPISKRLFAAGFAAAVCFATVGTAHAAGFAIYEQGTTGLGNAFAGAAAVAEDPTTIFWNPAGMTHLKGGQFAASGSVITPHGEFTNDGSRVCPTPTLCDPPGFPIAGNNGRDGAVAVFVPSFYYSQQVSDDIWLGVGMSSPYGLVTDYDPEWVGRYHGVHSELFTINLNPSVAYEVAEWLSVGVGVNIQYAYASLTSALDTGVAIGPPGGADSFLHVDGASFGFGANAGILIEPVKGTRLGIHYRSELEQNLSGDADLTVHPDIPEIGGGFFVGTADASVTLPDTVAISLYHELTDNIVLLGDATWTQWSDVPAIVIDIAGLPIANGLAVTTLNWEDTWRISGGVIWKATDDLSLRLGYAFDQSPVPSATFLTPRVPDDDRHWATIGGTYKIDDGVDLSLAYAHLFVGDVAIANNDPSPVPHFLIGSFDASVDIFSLQLTVDSEALFNLF